MNETPQSDFRIIFRLCALTAAAVAPFAVHHAMVAAWPMAALTGFLVAFTIAAMVLLVRWRDDPRFIRSVGRVIVLAANVTVLLSIAGQQQITIYWIYPLIFVNFYLLSVWPAAAINLIICGVSLWLVSGAVAPEELARLGGSLPLCIFFGLVFSQSIQRQRLALHHLANHDALTGVGNRHGLDHALADAAERLGRYDETTTLILLDIDHFKPINDSLGHLKGDEIIAEFANVVESRLRKTDRLYRFGGEEFVVLLPHTSLQEGCHLAESLRVAVEQHRFPYGRSITASGGVAELAAGESPDACLDRADRALYRAKEFGRNRVMEDGGHAGPEKRGGRLAAP